MNLKVPNRRKIEAFTNLVSGFDNGFEALEKVKNDLQRICELSGLTQGNIIPYPEYDGFQVMIYDKTRTLKFVLYFMVSNVSSYRIGFQTYPNMVHGKPIPKFFRDPKDVGYIIKKYTQPKQVEQ